MKILHRIALGLIALTLTACSGSEQELNDAQMNESVGLAGGGQASGNILPVNEEILDFRNDPNPVRNAYFGDLHVHTAYSFDAYAFGTTSTPDDAYRYARGEALNHPSGYEVQLQQGLDFYAVTDHAMFLGLVKEAANTDTEFSRYDVAEPLHDINAPDNMTESSLPGRAENFAAFVPNTLAGVLDGSIDAQLVEAITKSAWKDSIRAANEAYVPGQFTTFAALNTPPPPINAATCIAT